MSSQFCGSTSPLSCNIVEKRALGFMDPDDDTMNLVPLTFRLIWLSYSFFKFNLVYIFLNYFHRFFYSTHSLPFTNDCFIALTLVVFLRWMEKHVMTTLLRNTYFVLPNICGTLVCWLLCYIVEMEFGTHQCNAKISIEI